VTWAVSGLEGVKGGASGDMWSECAQEQAFLCTGNVIKIRYWSVVVLVTLLKNTHLKHGERKLHVLLFAFGSECSV